MKVEAIALDLRPRSMFEASDLGVRLVGAHARSVWRSVAPVYAVVFMLALSTVEIAGWLPPFVIFWLKPWLDRSLLFVLSRAVFGEPTRFADLWLRRRDVWWRQLLPMLTTARLSPWRSYALPVRQLEGQRGKALRARMQQILRSGRGSAFAMQWALSWAEFSIVAGLSSLALWFAPSGSGTSWFDALLHGGTTAASIVQTLCYGIGVALVEPFFVGAGFAMYLNRRVQLEAWDIEQEFRLAFAD
jgi:hypothetical protein